MDDFVFIKGVSGAAGGLNQIVHLWGEINDQLTKMTDTILGPDGTDSFDASCNTCSHFQRERFDRKVHVPSIYGFPGRCGRTGDRVTGWPRGIYCGHACYENRRTGGLGPEVHFTRPEVIHA